MKELEAKVVEDVEEHEAKGGSLGDTLKSLKST